ncbi:CcdC protein domain-containing protein [Catenulispora rubra]|uniref:CcdC protein domain-containing protein n=1 Tax=Catenulispora rubra TaxID=280293 RepID=UPI0018927130|nr:CcdC protein domain-containing protein [Catenulispora rubra]
MNGVPEIFLIIAVICFVMYKRVKGEPAQGKRMLAVPAVLIVVGIADVSKDAHNGSALAYLIATVAVSIVLGAWRAGSVRLAERDGIIFVHYTTTTVVLWLVNLAVKFGANAALKASDPHLSSALGNTLFLTLGAGMFVEGFLIVARAMVTGHQVIWSKGENGAPHQTSDLLDSLQQRLAGSGGRSSGRLTDARPTPKKTWR